MIIDNTDRKLLWGLQEGSEKSFMQLFEQYHRLLYALAYRYFKSAEDAEDAVQHTFMRLWEERENLDFTLGVRSLLFTILKNYILNELRHKRIVWEKNDEMVREQAYEEMDFSDILEDRDFRNHLYQTINALPKQKRMICLLKIQKGLSNQEIADQMNLSVATVKSHYTQAVKMLRSAVYKLILLFVMLMINM